MWHASYGSGQDSCATERVSIVSRRDAATRHRVHRRRRPYVPNPTACSAVQNTTDDAKEAAMKRIAQFPRTASAFAVSALLLLTGCSDLPVKPERRPQVPSPAPLV